MGTLTQRPVAPQLQSKPAEIEKLIKSTEQEFVLKAFEKLKDRKDGELRIAVRPNKRSGIVEIVYCGVHEKQEFEELRKLYFQLQQGTDGGKAKTF